MKALTIMQPWAELIASGEKRVENRTWRTRYRGPLAIHAGVSREWFDESEQGTGDRGQYDFGAVIAVAELVECLPFDEAKQRRLPGDELDWLADHEHTQGPWCWVLSNVRRLPEPIPCTGRQSLWEWEPPARLGEPAVAP